MLRRGELGWLSLAPRPLFHYPPHALVLPLLHEELLLWRVVLPGLRQRPMAKYHPNWQVVQVVTLDVRCAAAARTVVAVSAAVAEVGEKMPQLDALIVASDGESTPVAVVVV